ncbi:MAG: sulfatase-like hydrolase/transferase, partial [bacterium]|nr:sulfatase-like hydrolase/transferase [bacterium]
MADERPNVLLISIHDLNTHLGCYGNGVVQSPHLDRLASRGRVFQNHVCNYPLCGPSRASLLTGRRPDSTQVLDNMGWFRDALPDVVTLPAHFKADGYWTAKRGTVFHGGLDDEAAWDVGGKFTGPRPGRTPDQQKEREVR